MCFWLVPKTISMNTIAYYCRLCGDLNNGLAAQVSVTQMRVRGVLYMRRAIQIDVFTFLPLHTAISCTFPLSQTTNPVKMSSKKGSKDIAIKSNKNCYFSTTSRLYDTSPPSMLVMIMSQRLYYFVSQSLNMFSAHPVTLVILDTLIIHDTYFCPGKPHKYLHKPYTARN